MLRKENIYNIFKKGDILIIFSILIVFPLICIGVDEKDKIDMEKENKIKKIKEIFENRKKEMRFYPDKRQKEIIHREFKPFGELVIEVLLPKVNMRGMTYKRLNEEVNPIFGLFREMEEYAFPYLFKKRFEKDSYLRGSILWAIAFFSYKESILSLIEALDDKEICGWEIKDSPKWEPGSGKPERVCDLAYRRLLVGRLGPDISYEEIRKVEKEIDSTIRVVGQYESGDERIKMFKNWWQKNKERILSKYKEFKK